MSTEIDKKTQAIRVNPHTLFFTEPPPKKDPIVCADGTLDFEEMTIGDRIRWLREKRGDLQSYIATQAGISQAAIANLENNHLSPGFTKDGVLYQRLRSPRGATLTKIAQELGTSPDWVMTGIGSPTSNVRTKATEDEEFLKCLSNITPAQKKAIMLMVKTMQT